MPNTGSKNSRPKSIGNVAGAAGAGSSLSLSASSYARVLGANDRVRIGVIGIRGMGYGHIRGYSGLDNVEVVAVCDVDENVIAQKMHQMQQEEIPEPKPYIDLRKLYEDKTIDAVSINTPNHWHSLAAYWAVQAGKHAVVEKPGTHNIFEGQQLVKASRKYNRFIQHHAERRSFLGYKSAMEFLHTGGLGEVYMAKGICYKWRKPIGREKEEPVPPGVHYDLWLGPAPKRPFTRNRFHYNWHWHWDYGNGDLGNQGAHQMDIARWGLGVTWPTKISSFGGHFMFDDDQETPNSLIAVFEFPNNKGKGDKKKILQFEVRHWITNSEGELGEGASINIGNLFYGSEGYLVIDGSGDWRTYMGKNREPGPSGSGRGNMFQNLVDAIRSNDHSMLEGDILEGHRSCALIHMANTSYRLGRTLNSDPETERYTDDEANAMLKREYRYPYVLPDQV